MSETDEVVALQMYSQGFFVTYDYAPTTEPCARHHYVVIEKKRDSDVLGPLLGGEIDLDVLGD